MKVLKWFSVEGDDEHLCVGLADSAQTGEPPSDYRNERRPGGARVVGVCPGNGRRLLHNWAMQF